MKKIKVKAKGIKPFEIEVKDLTMDERIFVTEGIHGINKEPNKILQFSVDVCCVGTGLSKDELNIYSRNQLYALAMEIYNLAEKKS